MRVAIVVVFVGAAVAQYGPPKPTGPIIRRTTTTESPLEANEIVPTFPGTYVQSGQLPNGGNYQISGSSVSQPGFSSSSASSSVSWSGAGSNPPFNQPTNPQPQPIAPQAPNPEVQLDISKNPFIIAALSGKPVQPGNPQIQPQQPSPQYPQPQQPIQPAPTYPKIPPPQPSPQNPPPQQEAQPIPQPSYPQPQQPSPQYPQQPPSQQLPQQPQKPFSQNPFLSPKPQPVPQPPSSQYPQQQPVQPQQPIYPQTQPVQPQRPTYPQTQPQQPQQPTYPQTQPVQPQPSIPQGQPQKPFSQNPFLSPKPVLRPETGYPQPAPQQPSSQYPQQQPVQPQQPTYPQTQPLQSQTPPPQISNPQVQPQRPISQNPFIPQKPLPPQTGYPQPAPQPSLPRPTQPQPQQPIGYPQQSYQPVQQPQPQYQSNQLTPPKFQPSPYNTVTEGPVQKYTGPLNTTPPPGCAAALKCVEEIYCTQEGVMSDTPVTLTREQIENKVPLSECQNTDTGIIGKCCRDPNYKDPWPAGMMMMMMNPGFDDGQYRPEKYAGAQPQQPLYQPGQQQVTVPLPVQQPQLTLSQPQQPQLTNSQPVQQPQYTNSQPIQQPQPVPQYVQQPQPALPTLAPFNPHTIKKPLGVFNTDVTPFPVAPRPGQTHSQVFPKNEDKLATNQNAQAQIPLTPHHLSPDTPKQEPGQCGIRRPVAQTNPDETGFGEFPWHAVILSASNRSAICSGAIIAPNAVLTAAHCVDGINPEDMVVKAGEWTLGQPNEKPSQMRVVAASAIHPVYNGGSLVKDQAIVVMEKPFSFDTHIDKVCLPPAGTQYQPSTTNCYLTGWGRPALQNNAPGSVLHKIPVNVISKDTCENSLKQTHLGKYFILNEGFTCAAPQNEADLCKVDVGSPLVCERSDGHYELAGTYSWDTKCSTSTPAVMASCDTEWINQVLSTPIEELRAQQNAPKAEIIFVATDIDTKPGFALGYGK